MSAAGERGIGPPNVRISGIASRPREFFGWLRVPACCRPACLGHRLVGAVDQLVEGVALAPFGEPHGERRVGGALPWLNRDPVEALADGGGALPRDRADEFVAAEPRDHVVGTHVFADP